MCNGSLNRCVPPFEPVKLRRDQTARQGRAFDGDELRTLKLHASKGECEDGRDAAEDQRRLGTCPTRAITCVGHFAEPCASRRLACQTPLGDGLRIYAWAGHGIEVFEMGTGKMRVECLSIGIHRSFNVLPCCRERHLPRDHRARTGCRPAGAGASGHSKICRHRARVPCRTRALSPDAESSS